MAANKSAPSASSAPARGPRKISGDSAGPVKVNRKLSLAQLIGLSIAFYGSIRNVPQVALAGWSSVLWMGLSVIMFVIPMGLIAAELATGWSKRGGPEVWVKTAFGRTPGFLVAWLLWIMMFFGMVIVAMSLATMLAYAAGNPMISTPWQPEMHMLCNDNIYLMITTIAIYWIVTVINLVYKKAGSSFVNTGSILGIYIPAITLTVVGIAFIIEQAVAGNIGEGLGNIGNIPAEFFPGGVGGDTHASSTSGLELFSQIMWIYIGLEIASTRANDIDNPKKNYPIALLVSLGLMVVFNLGLGFIFASLIPAGEITLAQAVILPFQVIFGQWGVSGLTSIFALLMGFGMFAQLNSWVLGPSNAMYATAREGTLPKFFHKKTKNDVPIVFVITQAVVISCLIGLYTGLSFAGLGNVYGILLNETIILYCIAYILMIAAYIYLKYKDANVQRGYSIPFGKVGGWIATVLAMSAVITCIALCFFQEQPSELFMLIQNCGIYLGGSLLVVMIPVCVSFTKGYKNMSWRNEAELAEAANE